VLDSSNLPSVLWGRNFRDAVGNGMRSDVYITFKTELAWLVTLPTKW